MFLRALVGRCPYCGSGHLFKHWFKPHRRCPRCSLVIERGEGAMLGSMSINLGVTMVALIAFLVLWMVFDLPDVQVTKAIIAGAGVAIVVPILLFPQSKLVWAAIDVWMHGYDIDYADPDEARRLKRGE